MRGQHTPEWAISAGSCSWPPCFLMPSPLPRSTLLVPMLRAIVLTDFGSTAFVASWRRLNREYEEGVDMGP